MTLWKMYEWEHNGRDDSDWYAVYYDDVKDEVARGEIGTTRFANALPSSPPSIHRHENGQWVSYTLQENAPPDVIEKARAALARDQIYGMIDHAEKNRHELYPPVDVLKEKMELKLVESHRCQRKVVEKTACTKCVDTPGKWVNPKRSGDVRNCFGCEGKGYTTRQVVKKPIEWLKFEPGTQGTVVNWRSFGKFYRNGYNQPDGNNTTVYMRINNIEQDVAIPLFKLRITEERWTEEQMRAKAIEYSKSESAFYVPFATARHGLR
jgi:hypothetical protein